MFSSLSFNLAHRFWNERNHGGTPSVVPEVSTPSRRTNAAGRPVGILLYLASVGLIAAAIIGISFGTGFWLLASPTSETISASNRDPSRPNGDALKANEAVLRLAGATETPRSAGINLIPGSPLGQGSAAAEATPPQRSNIAQELSPAPPSSEPPVEMASVPQRVSGAATPPAYPMPLARPAAVAAEDAALSADNRGPTTRNGRGAHAQAVSRHSHPRSARAAPTLTPP